MHLKVASSIAGIALLAGTGLASAQDVVIVPEQETVIREYVKTKPAVSVELPGVELNVGSTIPQEVELYEIPDVEYRYVAVGGRTVLVEPQTRRVVRVLD